MGDMSQLVLDVEEDIQVDENLVQILKPHQKDGVAFMWKALFKEEHGCILAHCMGLGKTLQVVTLIHTYMSKNPKAKILIICPIIVIDNWKKEIEEWTRRCASNQNIPVEKIQSYLSEKDIRSIKKHWNMAGVGGVFICGYDKFCNLMKDDERTFQNCDILICDEGHTLKNPDSNKNKIVNKVETRYRIILSGTPLQNNLTEYYQMMKIVKGRIWCEVFDVESEELAVQTFNDIFVKPMTIGQYLDATPEQMTCMLYRSYVLHYLLKSYIHRRNGLHLIGMPEKMECVLYVCLTDVQKSLYEHYLEQIEEERSLQNLRPKTTLFRDKNIFTLICNHPKALNKKDNIDIGNNELIPSENQINNDVGEWWQNCCSNDELNSLEASNKLKLLFSILQECESSNEKVLLFSHSLATLDIIEYFLEENNKLRNRYYFRMDGTTQSEKRKDDINSFLTNNTSRLYLISTTAGGVGINLISASRVIIFDLSWNPSLEVQSIYRVYRIGQERIAKIYRFVAAGTMEEKIYNRQVAKLDIAERVVDQQQIDQHFNENDLRELYQVDTEISPGNFVDDENTFFAKQLKMNIVQKYDNSDRLLNNNLDDVLSDEKKKEALEDYHQALGLFK